MCDLWSQGRKAEHWIFRPILKTKFYNENILTLKTRAAREWATREGRESPVFEDTFSEPSVYQAAVITAYSPTYALQTAPFACCSRTSL